MPFPPPVTSAQLSHALAIDVGGVIVGAINEWNPRQTRTITELYEFGQITAEFQQAAGDPFEKVPGNISGMQISVRRYDIYIQQMETAFRTPDLTMLSRQDESFQCREIWDSPDSASNFTNIYVGCWFSDLGRTLSSTGDRLVNVSATLDYTSKRRA